MKKLLLILFVLSGFFANSQVKVNQSLGSTNTMINVRYGIKPDSLQGVPSDTFYVHPLFRNYPFVALKNDTLYVWSVSQQKWTYPTAKKQDMLSRIFVTNIGTGDTLSKQINDSTVQIKSLTGGFGINLTQNPNDVNIESDTTQLATVFRMNVIRDSLGNVVNQFTNRHITNLGDGDSLAMSVDDSTTGIKSLKLLAGANTVVTPIITDSTVTYQISSSVGSGTVRYVGAVVTAGDALTITGSPITDSGTLHFTWAGTADQYVLGNGWLSNFNTDVTTIGDARYAPLAHSHLSTDITDFTTAGRALFSGGTGISITDGVISWTGSASGISSFNGLSGTTQILSLDTTYTGATSWSSVGTTHTLRLPARLFNGTGGIDSLLSQYSIVGNGKSSNKFRLANDSSISDNTTPLAYQYINGRPGFYPVKADTADIFGIDSSLTFSNVAELRATQLYSKGGRLATTFGYTTRNDGGGSDYIWNPTSTATDDGIFVFKPNAISVGSPGRWEWRAKGKVRAAEVGVKSDGTNQSAIINALSALSTVNCIVFDNEVVASNSYVNFHGKTIIVENGAYFTGTGTIDSAYVQADNLAKVFDTTLTVTNIQNKIRSVYWFGAKSDAIYLGTYTDNYTPITKCLAAAPSSLQYAVYFPGFANSSILGAYYYCSKPILFTKNGHYFGDGSTKTVFIFPKDTSGFKIQGLGSRFDGFSLRGSFGNVSDGFNNSACKGLWLTAPNVTFSDVHVDAFTGYGWYHSADVTLGTNANQCFLYNCGANGNGKYGYFGSGGDANAGEIRGFSAIANAMVNVMDSTFLGNAWYSPHLATASTGHNYQQSVVKYTNNHIYIARQTASGIEPTVTSNWQNYWKDMGVYGVDFTPAFWLTWNNTTTYYQSGSMIRQGFNNSTGVYSPYIEADQIGIVNNTIGIIHDAQGSVEAGAYLQGNTANYAVNALRFEALDKNNSTGVNAYISGATGKIGVKENATSYDYGFIADKTNHLLAFDQNASTSDYSYFFTNATTNTFVGRGAAPQVGQVGFKQPLIYDGAGHYKILGFSTSRPTAGEVGDFYINSNPATADTFAWQKTTSGWEGLIGNGSALALDGDTTTIGPSSNNLKVIREVQLPATSYANSEGSGDRTSSITTSTTLAMTGTWANMIDGSTTGTGQFFSGGSVSGNYMLFDFGVGTSKYIDEIDWYQQSASSQGVYKAQASNDNSTWDDISSNFTLGTSATQTISISPNKGYRYYRLLGVSGNTSGVPWIYEIEFKINDASAGSSEMKMQTYKSGVATGKLQIQKDGGTTEVGDSLKLVNAGNTGNKIAYFDGNHFLKAGSIDPANVVQQSDSGTLFRTAHYTDSVDAKRLINPMTNTGDIIYSSDNSGTPARLAGGTNGYMLSMISGAPAWVSGATWAGGVSSASISASTTASVTTTTQVYVCTSTTDATYTLPAIATNKFFFFKNAGTANMIIQRAGTDVIYTTSSVTSVTLAAGESMILFGGTTSWYKF